MVSRLCRRDKEAFVFASRVASRLHDDRRRASLLDRGVAMRSVANHYTTRWDPDQERAIHHRCLRSLDKIFLIAWISVRKVDRA